MDSPLSMPISGPDTAVPAVVPATAPAVARSKMDEGSAATNGGRPAEAVSAARRVLPPHNRNTPVATAATCFRERRIIEPTPGPNGPGHKSPIPAPSATQTGE